MAIVAERFVARLGVVRIKYTNDDPTIRVPDPVDLFDLQGGYVTLNNYLPTIRCYQFKVGVCINLRPSTIPCAHGNYFETPCQMIPSSPVPVLTVDSTIVLTLDKLQFDVQARGLPEEIGKKDKFTTQQAIFECVVCDCELKSIKTLRAHCKVRLR